MRTLPRAARVAIAALYLRHRDARRQEARLRLALPPESPAVMNAMHTVIDASNALIAVRATVIEQGDGPHHTTHEFMRLVALHGRALARAA